MIPSPGQTLTDIAVRIATHLMPALNSNFTQADSGLITALLLAFGQDFERAIYNRMTDIDEIKTVCAQVRESPIDDRSGLPSQQELDDFMQQTPTTLMLADVNELHAHAMELLIRIHAWAENHDSDLDRQVWRLLRHHCERNKFDLPVF